MSSERAEERSVSADVPESVADWLKGQALDAGTTPDEILRRHLVALHAVADGEDGAPAGAGRSPAAVERLREELRELEATYRDDLDDVRERVVDVKLDADEKAPADHDHDELRERAERAAAEAEAVEAAVADLRDDMDAGFDNYEEILSYLTETTDELESKVETLARALVETRRWARTAGVREAERAAVAELARNANRSGIRRAQCGECGGTVDVALLTAPECPFCASAFADLEANTGLTNAFTPSVLVVGDPPALPDAPAADVAVEDIVGAPEGGDE